MYNFNAIEEVLKNYPLLKAQVAVEVEELKNMFPSCIASYSGDPHGSELSDSTARFGIKRESMSDNMKRARVIEIAYEALTAREKDLVKYMYFERWNPYQIRLRLGVGKTHLFRIKITTLEKIAKIIC